MRESLILHSSGPFILIPLCAWPHWLRGYGLECYGLMWYSTTRSVAIKHLHIGHGALNNKQSEEPSFSIWQSQYCDTFSTTRSQYCETFNTTTTVTVVMAGGSVVLNTFFAYFQRGYCITGNKSSGKRILLFVSLFSSFFQKVVFGVTHSLPRVVLQLTHYSILLCLAFAGTSRGTGFP